MTKINWKLCRHLPAEELKEHYPEQYKLLRDYHKHYYKTSPNCKENNRKWRKENKDIVRAHAVAYQRRSENWKEYARKYHAERRKDPAIMRAHAIKTSLNSSYRAWDGKDHLKSSFLSKIRGEELWDSTREHILHCFRKKRRLLEEGKKAFLSHLVSLEDLIKFGIIDVNILNSPHNLTVLVGKRKRDPTDILIAAANLADSYQECVGLLRFLRDNNSTLTNLPNN